ncbi:MAG: hypothetical protein HYY04_08570 [Chloroflexi bacterium]|nr:hypothetical protein [Chloroflexota bacterium]
MLQRRFLRRALTGAAQLLRTVSSPVRRSHASSDVATVATLPEGAVECGPGELMPALSAAATTTVEETGPLPSCAPDASPDAGELPAGAAAEEPVGAPEPEVTTDDRWREYHQHGLEAARNKRWNWAQRQLEQAIRLAPGSQAREDLETVRTARRCLRLLEKRPRDAATHLLLGRCYFELDMGEDAERQFRRANVLSPGEPAPYYFLALEYCYRGALEEAEKAYQQAAALAEDLPPFSALLAEYQHLAGDDEPSAEPVGGATPLTESEAALPA